MESPCIRICRIDEDSGLCIGCLRSLDEIARWTSFTPDERARIGALLPARRGLAGTRPS